MKKIICFICSIALAFSSFSVLAKDIVLFASKEKNPNLIFPINEKTVMVGGSLATEAEDWSFTSDMDLQEDDAASGSKLLYVSATEWIDTPEELSAKKNPSMSLDITVDKTSNTYTIWAYMKLRGTTRETSYYFKLDDNAYSAAIFSKTPDTVESGNYFWVKLRSNVELSVGTHTLAFQHRSCNAMFDRIVITADGSWEPSGRDDSPVPMDENASGIFPAPTHLPPAGVHPRVYVTSDDIAEIKTKSATPLLKPVYDIIVSNANEELNCNLADKVGNNSSLLVSKLQSRAFMYLIGEVDKNHAKQTVRYAKEYIETVQYNMSTGDITRSIGEQLVMTAIVYDWCYDVLSDVDKEYFIRKTIEFAGTMELGYPPIKRERESFCGHGTEGGINKDLLSVGIAMFDEEPEIYNLAAGRLFSKMVEGVKFFSQSGAHSAGAAYGKARYDYQLHAHKLMKAIGVDYIYGEDFLSVPYTWMYETLPSGNTFKDGDDFDWASTNAPGYHINSAMAANRFSSGETGDSYLMQQYLLSKAIKSYSVSSTPVFELLFTDPFVEAKHTDELPLARKTTYPLSSITARTGWQSGLDSPVAVVRMHMNNVQLSDHQHQDVGSFQIYYKGMLALHGGQYQKWGDAHYHNYMARSVAHNVLLVHDPDEKPYIGYSTPQTNDGGQRSAWDPSIDTYEDLYSDRAKLATEVESYIGPNEKTPKFSYMQGNLKSAYTDKIEKYDRSMVFMDLFDDEYPAAFVVYDRVKSSNKDFKKSWILNTEAQPKVSGMKTTVTRTDNGFNGKLVNNTMLPSSATIETIGGEGQKFYSAGQEWPTTLKGAMTDSGNYRIEVSPRTASQEDVFLNAMYVTDADGNAADLPMYKETGANYYGVTVKDRMVTFAKNYEKIDSAFSLTVRNNGFENVSCLVTDVKEGMWKISNAETTVFVKANAGENVLYFECKPGTYNVEPAEETATETTFETPEANKVKAGDFLLLNMSDKIPVYQAKPTKLIDGVPYMAPVAFAEYFNRTVAQNGNSVTISGGTPAAYTADSLNYTLNGLAATLKHTPKMIDGILYVACDDLQTPFNYTGKYDTIGKNYLFRERVVNLPDDFPKDIKTVTPISVVDNGNDGNVCDNTIDSNIDTRWSSNGTAQWMLYDLGAEYDLTEIMMSFYDGDKRYTKFEIFYSLDNVTFTSVFDGKNSGTTNNFETFAAVGRARYVKILFKGNSINTWNSVTEVVFPVK